jgi:tRNA-dihydrouridine synthase
MSLVVVGAALQLLGLLRGEERKVWGDGAYRELGEDVRKAEGLNGLALHACTREQGYSGQAQWHWIAQVKQAVGIPVMGNGDIRTPEDAAAMVADTGCDAVMIGRAAPANPWIFRQIAEYTATGSYERPTTEDRYRMIRAYFEMLLAEADATKDLPRDARMGDAGALADRSMSVGWDPAGKMKQFATWFTHGVPGGAKLRAAIYQARNGADVLGGVERFCVPRIEADESFEAEANAYNEAAVQAMPDAEMICG